MRKVVVPLVLVFVALCAPVASARIAEDAHCDSNLASMLNHRRYSESFVAGRTGKLVKGYFESFGAGDFVVEIWDADESGLPTGSAPLTYAVATSDVSGGYEPLFAPFPKPVSVRKGKTYVFVVEVPDPATTGVTVGSPNPCPGTFAHEDAVSGGAYTIDSYDMAFATWIRVRRRR